MRQFVPHTLDLSIICFVLNCRIAISVDDKPASPRSMQELDQIYGRVGHPTISMLGWGQPDPKPPSPVVTPKAKPKSKVKPNPGASQPRMSQHDIDSEEESESDIPEVNAEMQASLLETSKRKAEEEAARSTGSKKGISSNIKNIFQQSHHLF